MQEEKRVLFTQISMALKDLIKSSDITVFTLYDPKLGPQSEPILHRIGDKSMGLRSVPINFDFEGIGVWYIIKRERNIFNAIKILAYMQNQKFIQGQVGDFEGYWEDFSTYIAEDRWVQNIMNNPIANDNLTTNNNPTMMATNRRINNI